MSGYEADKYFKNKEQKQENLVQPKPHATTYNQREPVKEITLRFTPRTIERALFLSLIFILLGYIVIDNIFYPCGVIEENIQENTNSATTNAVAQVQNENLDDTDVDSVVKFFIFVLIFVFDPMAVIFVISYNVTLQDRKKKSPHAVSKTEIKEKNWPVYGEKKNIKPEKIDEKDVEPDIEEPKPVEEYKLPIPTKGAFIRK